MSYVLLLTCWIVAAAVPRIASVEAPVPAPLRADFADNDSGLDLPRGVQRFLLFTTQRAGTGWTMHKFESRAPFIRAEANEPLQGLIKSVSRAEFPHISWPVFEAYLNKTFERRCGKLGSYAEELACGWKFMYNQLPQHLSYEQLFQYCAKNNIAVIHLVRANSIRHLISRGNHQLDMSQLGHKQDPHPRTVASFRKIELNIEEVNLTNLLIAVAAARNALMNFLPGLHMEVSYEALLASDRQCRAMFAFLNPHLGTLPCNDADGKNAIKKQHAGHTCQQWVTNWKHVKNVTELFKQHHPVYKNTAIYYLRDCQVAT